MGEIRRYQKLIFFGMAISSGTSPSLKSTRYGSYPLFRADWIKLMIAAARLPLRSDPAKSQFLRPSAQGRTRCVSSCVYYSLIGPQTNTPMKPSYSVPCQHRIPVRHDSLVTEVNELELNVVSGLVVGCVTVIERSGDDALQVL